MFHFSTEDRRYFTLSSTVKLQKDYTTMQHFDTHGLSLFLLACILLQLLFGGFFLSFQVILFYASGCTWSRCTATRAHTPRPGWSSSQSVLRSVLWSPVGFPYCAMCRRAPQKRRSTLGNGEGGEKKHVFLCRRILWEKLCTVVKPAWLYIVRIRGNSV